MSLNKIIALGLALTSASLWNSAAATFRVASYNVENYVDVQTDTRETKSEEAREKVAESILALRPDVIALQEMGRVTALKDLQARLKRKGLDLPYFEHASGFDTNIFVAILSKYPFKSVQSYTNENFLLNGRRLRTSRGFAHVQFEPAKGYTVDLLTAHLKSKRAVEVADEAEIRLEEAKLLREKVDSLLRQTPSANIIVAGDFNDTRDSASTRAVIGRNSTKLVDTRPAERNGDDQPNTNPAWDPRNICWTHFYGKEDSYARIDFILVSPGLAREWVQQETYVLALPNWGVASDHRPIVATFEAADK